MPNTIERAIKDKYKDKYPPDSEELKKKLKEMLPRYTHLRGLDGDIPAAKNEKDKQDKQKSEIAVDQQFSKERPEGTSQFDYIRRLADEIIAKIEKNNLKSGLFNDEAEVKRYKAIGLLGSDADDKLILLQALRSRLPGMVFFTTDMDARLIPQGSHDWGHNLIVASSFGLNLNKSYQGGIPPFRDAYQTSIFLATQLAVCGDYDTKADDIHNLLKAKHNLLDKWLEEQLPQLFEIGRTKVFNITPKDPKQQGNYTEPTDEQQTEQVCSLVKKLSQHKIDINDIPKLNPPVLLQDSLLPSKELYITFVVVTLIVILFQCRKPRPLGVVRVKRLCLQVFV